MCQQNGKHVKVVKFQNYSSTTVNISHTEVTLTAPSIVIFDPFALPANATPLP